MATLDTPGAFESAILKAMEQEIARVVEEEAAKAAANVERRIKERTTQLVMTVLDRFSVQSMGRELLIRVQHD